MYKTLFPVIILCLFLSSILSCEKQKDNNDVIELIGPGGNLEVPARYIHQTVAMAGKRTGNTLLLEFPVSEIDTPGHMDLVSVDKIIMFRIYMDDNVDSKKNNMSINILVDKINSLDVDGQNIQKYKGTNWYKAFTDDITYQWHVIKKTPPIVAADIISTCSKGDLVESDCLIPEFSPKKNIHVSMSINLSQLPKLNNIKQHITGLVRSWAK